MSRERRILMVAGEASGDRHAAGLVREALALDPALRFSGIGGNHLRAAGVEVLLDAKDLAVVGIAEVFGHAGELLGALGTMRRRLRDERPDALLLVDFPDFNLHLAGVARRLGIPVIYFISPQVWAWRRGRVRKIRRRVRRMIVLFPFEAEFYRAHGVPVTFVGHPVAEDGLQREPAAEARARLGLRPEGPVFGLLPGSRQGEIRHLLDRLFETAAVIVERVPQAAFLLPVADTLDSGEIGVRAARTGLPIVALAGAFDQLVAACDAAVAASGTVTLELAVRGVPPVVVYRTSPLSYWIGRAAVSVRYVSLVNLIAGRGIVPELLQGDFTPRRAADELLRLGMPGTGRDDALAAIAEVRARLGPPGAYRRAAEAFLAALD